VKAAMASTISPHSGNPAGAVGVFADGPAVIPTCSNPHHRDHPGILPFLDDPDGIHLPAECLTAGTARLLECEADRLQRRIDCLARNRDAIQRLRRHHPAQSRVMLLASDLLEEPWGDPSHGRSAGRPRWNRSILKITSIH
jgi:hypothetical protein